QNSLIGSAAGTLAPSEITERIEALSSYYPFLDHVISPLVRSGAQSGNTVIVTQPGRVQNSVGGLFGIARLPPSEMTCGARPETVARMILVGLGLPNSREVGRGDAQMFGESLNYKYRWVPSYGRPFTPNTPRTGKPLDQEMIDRLRSLGYVK